jgi:hypothetical protein
MVPLPKVLYFEVCIVLRDVSETMLGKSYLEDKVIYFKPNLSRGKVGKPRVFISYKDGWVALLTFP